ncbi:MAG: galE, partial [Caulobacteraceae bacterium]|nr:galE [Caulobacteraceae bacterium]
HVLALNHLLAGGATQAFNLGTGVGTTVRELIAAIEAAGGMKIPVVEEPRRPGDAPILVADNAKARAGLGWTPRRTLADIVESAWRWHVG